MPLHTIEAQLVLECERLGIPAMAGSQVIFQIIQLEKCDVQIVADFAEGVRCCYGKQAKTPGVQCGVFGQPRG